MRRSIQSLVTKVSQTANGDLTGGFGAIRGGTMQYPANNGVCTNGENGTGECSGTNGTTCTNAGDCSRGSNSSTCTNSGTCFAS